jgi:hypothetical protein
MAENVDTSSALTGVAERAENEVPENEVPGTAVPENDANSGSDTVVTQNEPKWYRDGDAWVKLFLEPIAPGKFKQFDHVYDVPGKNEFPKERWSSAECKDGFHITRRRGVRDHLDIHDYKSVYIAEVVSMGDEFYENPRYKMRKVRVVTFGPAVPLIDVLGKHPDDRWDNDISLSWPAANNQLDLFKLAISMKTNPYNYIWAFHLALKNGNDRIAELLVEKCKVDDVMHQMIDFAIRHDRVDFVKRMVENMPVNVKFFEMACVNGRFEIFQFFRAKYGEPDLHSCIIPNAVFGDDRDILDYIKSRGVDMSDFGMLVYACAVSTPRSNANAVKYLVSEGANVNHPLIAYIAKRYSRGEVREYLLAQIDDKSEVSRCDKLEDEIEEICNIFFEKNGAGRFS